TLRVGGSNLLLLPAALPWASAKPRSTRGHPIGPGVLPRGNECYILYRTLSSPRPEDGSRGAQQTHLRDLRRIESLGFELREYSGRGSPSEGLAQLREPDASALRWARMGRR